MPDHRPPPPARVVPDRRPPPPAGQRAPIGFRVAPLAFALALVSAPVAGWFSVWGLDHVNRCDAQPVGHDCGLGFAVLLPIAWVVTAGIVAAVVVTGCLRVSRRVAWLSSAVATTAIWAVDVAAMSAYQPR